MLSYDLSKRGNYSLYEYLFQCLARDILEGVIKPGEKLPSKRNLASHLNVGVITVMNAYEMLAMEGYIQPVEKKGYFVQDLRGNKIRTELGSMPDESEPEEKEFFADFRANRTSLKLFPSTSWNYYMRQAISLQDDSLLKTIPFKGLFELRKAIAEHLFRNRGIVVSPSSIIIGAGTEYLYSRLIQLFDRSCIFASEDPGYKKFSVISASYGNPWKFIRIDDNGLKVDELERSGADVVHVSPSNHFPTGIIMSVTRRAELLEWAYQKKERYIIEDDYDSEFRYSGHLIYPVYTQDKRDKVIYINTFSKSLVPSLRISYMILPPQLLERYEKSLSFYSCTVSSFEQYTLAKFISGRNFERHIGRMKNYYRKQREKILKEIEASPLSGISDILERAAGTHFLMRVHTVLSEEEIRREALKNDLSISLLTDYSDTVGKWGRKILVINYAAVEPEKIAQVIERLSNIFPECRQDNRRSGIDKQNAGLN